MSAEIPFFLGIKFHHQQSLPLALFFPKQFLDLNTCLILALKLGTEKKCKEEKTFFLI